MSEINWAELFEMWLLSRESASTRRGYESAWNDLLEFTGKQIGGIESLDIVRWMSAMRERGLAPKTIRSKMCGVSSYYNFINEFLDDPVKNPTSGIKRPIDKAMESPYFLTISETHRLLGSIDRSDVLGKRDYALFLFYIASGRRNSEIRRLRWGDFYEDGGKRFYKWTGKWHSRGHHEIPQMVYDAIIDYLSASNRLLNMTENKCIFPSPIDETKPLGSRQVGRLLKKYADIAGLDTKRIHVHSLRHTAAMLRLQVGDNVGSISKMLGHATVMNTEFYLHQLAGRNLDRSWDKVAELLGVDE